MKKLLLLLLVLLPIQSQAARLFVASNSDRIVHPGVVRWTTQISFSAWVYPVTFPIPGQIIMGENGAGGYRYLFTINNTGTQHQIYFVYSDLGGLSVAISANVTVTQNQWSHIAVAFDNTTNPDTCLIYLNGVSQTTTAPGDHTGPASGSGGSPRIGDQVAGVEVNFFDGRIAEPALWIDVPILNQSEVTALVRGARPDKVRFNPTVYYPLEGWQTSEPDYGVNHVGTTSISGTSRADGPPVLPR